MNISKWNFLKNVITLWLIHSIFRMLGHVNHIIGTRQSRVMKNNDNKQNKESEELDLEGDI